ncbi:SufB/SufD family protein [Oceanomicrobium pacificus]|uniref:Fe-S cluster assembly protein SufD n=1 Tax=Oceanomicrobium pacificus TaxID=2692916 RepID=A0A6B0TVS2_9RHOB|nr:SufD family Fe-S cluster assembly protein [Oceanomicrobium pacificus]MXU65865.1 Fe-S cluster assembly protein SufD [Oceanomicrobium pacificus]
MGLALEKDDPVAALVDRLSRDGTDGGWAAEARSAALSRLAGMGLPGRRDEYWKFTNPAPLTAAAAADVAAMPDETADVFAEATPLRLVFVDGRFDADASDALALDGLEIETLATAQAADIHWARDVYGVLEAAGQSPVERPLAALNSAVARDGIVIRATGQVTRPVQFHHRHTAASADCAVHHVIRVEEGAALTVLETGAAAARFNKVMEVEVADTGRFNHVRIQGRDRERLAATHLFARLEAESAFKSFTLTVNGALTRNECVIELTGDDATAHVAGACIGEGDFHHDDTVFITHDAVNCESRQVFKKVLKSGATGVFQGKILVQPDAQKTDGYQISQGLLLDDDSQFLAKPELEIYADDVVCSHGSTCGAVDETSLFYLTSRGISKEDATDMLVLAFVDEAIQEIEDDALADVIRAQLAGWLDRRRG